MKEKYRSGKYGSIPELIWYATPGEEEGRMGHLIPCPAFVKRGIFWEGGRKGACCASRQQRVIFSHRKIERKSFEVSFRAKVNQKCYFASEFHGKASLLFLWLSPIYGYAANDSLFSSFLPSIVTCSAAY